MSLSKKLLILVVSGVLLSFLVSQFLLVLAFKNSFLSLERQSIERNVQRVVNDISAVGENLNADTRMLAGCEDTYYFTGDGNEHLINELFSDDNFNIMALNIMLVLDTDGQTVQGRAYDLDEQQEIPVPQELDDYLSAGIFTEPAGISGIILLSDLTVFVSAQPIINTEAGGQNAGTLVLGKFIDPAYIDALAPKPYSSVTLYPKNSSRMPDDLQEAMGLLTREGEIVTQPLDNDYAAGYTLMEDIRGDPAVIARVTVSRDIYKQWQRTFIHLAMAMACECALITCLFILILKKVILVRLTALARDVEAIGSTGDISRHVSSHTFFKGHDELSILEDNINNMLDKVREAESKLLAQRNQFDRVLLFTPNIVVVVDETVTIKFINKAFCSLFNVTEAEVINKHLSKYIPIEDIHDIDRKISREEGSLVNHEITLNINNTERIMETAVITMSPEEFLIIGRDITEQREEQAKLYLNERLASIGEIASGIAHEINNPLTAIVMLSQLLVQTELPGEVKKDISDIHSEASRATEVVKNLLTFARKQATAKSPTRINALLNNVLRIRDYEQSVNNIDVVTSLAPDIPDIIVDSVQIQQVFLNLVLNAEYSMIHSHQKGQLLVESYMHDGKIFVSFTDDGEGIEEKNVNKIFQPFFTTKEVGFGTGLGLSLSYGIIRGHDGMIHVRSKYGFGATFTVELPIETPGTNGVENDV